MAPLTSEQIRKENGDGDSSSITSLTLTLRALSDVSCLREFLNLERLDLSCNNLSSIQELGSCVNLKWLSVVQNKLTSLKGIQSLSKLTVFNAGQNKINSMDQVRSLTSLRALILNDNNISSICKLDKLGHLNTLVLSRNPIHSVGKSLENVKSITKLSLSNCQIQEIGSSLVSCVDLKEARFAHNEIVDLPNHLERNARLQLLDLGKNAISNWSNMKVLSTLKRLRNLNIQGNPISEGMEKEKLEEKVKRLVADLQILNGKPIGSSQRSKKRSETEGDIPLPQGDDRHHKNDVDVESKSRSKRKRGKADGKGSERNVSGSAAAAHSMEPMNGAAQETKENHQTKCVSSPFDSFIVKAANEVKQHKIGAVEVKDGIREFDDGEISFADMVRSEDGLHPEFKVIKSNLDDNLGSGLAMNPKKKKKNRVIASGSSALELLPSVPEIGMGGPSAWDD